MENEPEWHEDLIATMERYRKSYPDQRHWRAADVHRVITDEIERVTEIDAGDQLRAFWAELTQMCDEYLRGETVQVREQVAERAIRWAQTEIDKNIGWAPAREIQQELKKSVEALKQAQERADRESGKVAELQVKLTDARAACAAYRTNEQELITQIERLEDEATPMHYSAERIRQARRDAREAAGLEPEVSKDSDAEPEGSVIDGVWYPSLESDPDNPEQHRPRVDPSENHGAGLQGFREGGPVSKGEPAIRIDDTRNPKTGNLWKDEMQVNYSGASLIGAEPEVNWPEDEPMKRQEFQRRVLAALEKEVRDLKSSIQDLGERESVARGGLKRALEELRTMREALEQMTRERDGAFSQISGLWERERAELKRQEDLDYERTWSVIGDEKSAKSLNAWRDEVHQNAVSKGFWEEPVPTFGDKLALIHSEVSEALEEFRKGHAPDQRLYSFKVTGDWQGDVPQSLELARAAGLPIKPEGIPSELVDVIIRVLDLCGRYKIDVDAVMEEKAAYNATRKHRHGGKTL